MIAEPNKCQWAFPGMKGVVTSAMASVEVGKEIRVLWLRIPCGMSGIAQVDRVHSRHFGRENDIEMAAMS